MNNPLEQLRDLHLPAPISWWPPAPGWWILLGLGILLLLGWQYLWKAKPAYHTAFKELHALRTAYGTHQQSSVLVADISVLLRRYTLAVYNRKQVASLTGTQWLSFLNKTGRTQAFTDGAGHVLSTVPYGGHEPVDAHELLKVIERWLKTNRRAKT